MCVLSLACVFGGCQAGGSTGLHRCLQFVCIACVQVRMCLREGVREGKREYSLKEAGGVKSRPPPSLSEVKVVLSTDVYVH